MRRGDLGAVASDANETDQSLFARLDRGFDHAARTQGAIPFNRIGQIVQLPEIEVIDSQSIQGFV